MRCMFGSLSNFFGGMAKRRFLREIEPIVRIVNSWEADISALSDEALKAKTQEFKKRLLEGAILDDVLPEAYAVVRETSRRLSGERHYDVQIMGGIVLHR